MMKIMERVKTVEEITAVMRNKAAADIELIKKSYAFAEHSHHGQKRYSGDPYFVHVANVGFGLAQWRRTGTEEAS